MLAVGLATSVACFLVGQWILRGNGFNYEGGYPAVTLADGEAFRAVVGSAVYLGILALFSLGVGAIARHTAGAITVVLAAVLAPGHRDRLPAREPRRAAREVLADGCRPRDPADRRATGQHSDRARRRAWPSSPPTAAVALLVALWLDRPARRLSRSASAPTFGMIGAVAIRPAELIERKRNGEELSDEEISELVLGYARGESPTTRWPPGAWPSTSAG